MARPSFGFGAGGCGNDQDALLPCKSRDWRVLARYRARQAGSPDWRALSWARWGRTPTVILSKAGLTAEDARNPVIRLEVPTQIKLLELAAEELQDELLGFHLARSFDLREIRLVYYAIASSEQLADALRNTERYSQIMNEGVRLRFSLQDQAATIALDYVNVDRHAERHQIEFWLVALIRICRQITDTRLAPSRLKMKHFRNGAPAEFGTFFGSNVEFGADGDAISFPAPLAALPVVGRDEYLNELLRRYAEEAPAQKPRARPTCARGWRKFCRSCCRTAEPWHRKLRDGSD
jgi:hypothetical protein